MASVTFSTGLGGDGSTVTDDADPTTGLAGYGYTVRLVPALGQVIGVANYTKGRAEAAAASVQAAANYANQALNAPGTIATSSTSLAINSTSNPKVLTLNESGKLFAVGQTVVIASTTSPGNQMAGIITEFTGNVLKVNVGVSGVFGSGTFNSWTISVGALLAASLPSQTGETGKFLGTNNGTAIWQPALTPNGNLAGLADRAAARANLDVEYGVDVQAYDAGLNSIAGLTTVGDRMLYTTGPDAYAVTPLTSFARQLLDDADNTTARTTLGAQQQNAKLQSLADLTLSAGNLLVATGPNAIGMTILSSFARTFLDDTDESAVRTTLGAAASGTNTDIKRLDGLTTPLSVAQGGTGGATKTAARAALGISAGTTAPSGGDDGDIYLRYV